ncbi:MAG: hypothetical protein IH604_03745 [Burkholderiales bacterium]|nr:hypothetical protein [Burkholderiales bacterium]
MRLFALPLIGRNGLGNGLFPWARAELFAREFNATILAPHWAQFRLGPYLRREPEKRNYGGVFHAEHHVRGISRQIVSTLSRRVAEDQVISDFREIESLFPTVVEFSGIGGLFSPLVTEHEFIRHRLWTMTKAPLRSAGELYGGRFIAMHVRRGDLTRQGFTAQELKEVRQFTPLEWFIDMAQSIRRFVRLRSVPIVVFTDGAVEEIQALRQIDGVCVSQRQRAITDLWTMAHASLLFASGFSTFSMWASFLGGMPTIYAPGKIQQRVQSGRPHSMELELFDGPNIPSSVLERLSADLVA